MVADAIDNLIDSGPPVSAWDALASEQRQANAECEDEGTVPETFVSCGDEELLNTTFVDVPADAQSQPTDNSLFCYRRFEIVTGQHDYGMTQSLNNGNYFYISWNGVATANMTSQLHHLSHC